MLDSIWLDTNWEGIHFPSEGTASPLSSSFQSCSIPMIPDPIYVICRYSFDFIALKNFTMFYLGMDIFKLVVLDY